VSFLLSRFASLPLPDPDDPAELLAEYLLEMKYRALIPDAPALNEAWLAACTELEALDIPVLAANVYYDGSDEAHEAGENVLTPYIVLPVSVDGQEHLVGILGLMNPESAAADLLPGFRFTHPDNRDAALAWEAARYIPQMKADGCEMIILCCFGDTEFPSDPADANKWIHPVITLARNTEGIDLFFAAPAGNLRPGKSALRNKSGRQIPILWCDDGLVSGVFRFSLGKNNTLVFSISEGGVR
jgi:hypothetical protein